MIITLASASPRRKELIFEIKGLTVNIVPACGEEKAVFVNAGQFACALARHKAEEVFSRAGGIVVGADTIVVMDGQVLGKPHDKSDAERMLKSLSGKTHSVITGVCVKSDKKLTNMFCETFVSVGELDDRFIENYISTGSPMDKAGAYGLQDEMFYERVTEVNGDVRNVIGLPVKMLEEILKENFNG